MKCARRGIQGWAGQPIKGVCYARLSRHCCKLFTCSSTLYDKQGLPWHVPLLQRGAVSIGFLFVLATCFLWPPQTSSRVGCSGAERTEMACCSWFMVFCQYVRQTSNSHGQRSSLTHTMLHQD